MSEATGKVLPAYAYSEGPGWLLHMCRFLIGLQNI